jgi:hypothetical protein
MNHPYDNLGTDQDLIDVYLDDAIALSDVLGNFRDGASEDSIRRLSRLLKRQLMALRTALDRQADKGVAKLSLRKAQNRD